MDLEGSVPLVAMNGLKLSVKSLFVCFYVRTIKVQAVYLWVQPQSGCKFS